VDFEPETTPHPPQSSSSHPALQRDPQLSPRNRGTAAPPGRGSGPLPCTLTKSQCADGSERACSQQHPWQACPARRLNPSRARRPGHPGEGTQKGHAGVVTPLGERWAEGAGTVTHGSKPHAPEGQGQLPACSPQPLGAPQGGVLPWGPSTFPSTRDGSGCRIAPVRAGSEGRGVGTCPLHPDTTERGERG